MRFFDALLAGGKSAGGGSVTLQEKTVTENGTVQPDTGYDGLSKVVVDVPGIVPSGTIDITENGSYDVTNFATALVEIAASGGGVDFSATPFSAMACGTVTPSESQSQLQITHNLGQTPKFMWFFTGALDAISSTSSACTASVMSYVVTDTAGTTWNIKSVTGKGNVSWSAVDHITGCVVQGDHLSNTTGYKPAGVSEVSATSATFRFRNNNSGVLCYFLPITYTWIVMA